MSNDRVTIADVAERAGVSAATVGRVVGGYGSVSNKTRDKILSAIAWLYTECCRSGLAFTQNKNHCSCDRLHIQQLFCQYGQCN